MARRRIRKNKRAVPQVNTPTLEELERRLELRESTLSVKKRGLEHKSREAHRFEVYDVLPKSIEKLKRRIARLKSAEKKK